MVNLLLKIFLLLFTAASFTTVYPQPDDDLKNIELTQEQWEAVRDTFAIYAIKHLARLDTLQMEIDSLRKVNEMIDNYDCENDLYAIVGATKQQVEDFRRKFNETEKKVNGKIGTPDDARAYYFNEISASKIRCLPEFWDRFASMQKKLEPWQSTNTFTSEGTYNVVKGDCLWLISQRKYTTPYLWPAIWDANKVSIVNPEKFHFTYYHRVSNPNLIYPGQVLKIPVVSDAQKIQTKEKLSQFRRRKNLHKN